MAVLLDLAVFSIVVWAITGVMVFNMYWMLVVQQRTIDPLLQVIQQNSAKMSELLLHRLGRL
jgi:hypothetical protein